MRRGVAAATSILLAAPVALAGSSTAPTPYRLTARQAQEVGAAIAFVGAFNGHRLEAALRVLAPDALISDCDYRRVQVVQFSGKRGVARWLRARFADHDFLGVEAVLNENASDPVGAMEIDYFVRRSRTLAQLGFPQGITPQLGTKVRFTLRGPVRITAFANGPLGGSSDLCRPR
jgi:hypothetical protein